MPAQVAYTLEARAEVQAVAFNWQGGGTQTSLGYDPESGITGSLHVGQTPAVAVAHAIRTAQTGSNGWGVDPNTAYTLDQAQGQAVQAGMAVRRLTPRECERLQGFPDDYTAIPWRGKAASECPDGPRYKALGNSMAVPVMRWIGERIDQTSAIRSNREAA